MKTYGSALSCLLCLMAFGIQAQEPAVGHLLICDSADDRIVRIDPTSGAVNEITGPSRGTGPGLQIPLACVIIDNSSLIVCDAGLQALLRVNISTGDRSILSSNTQGSGQGFGYPRGLALMDDGRLAVTDSRLDAVLAVDANSGNRTVLSGQSAGSGPDLDIPIGLSVAPGGEVIVVDAGLKAVVGIDPALGTRRIISSSSIGAGTDFIYPRGLTVDHAGTIFVADSGLDAILSLNPAGDRSILTRSSGAIPLAVDQHYRSSTGHLLDPTTPQLQQFDTTDGSTSTVPIASGSLSYPRFVHVAQVLARRHLQLRVATTAGPLVNSTIELSINDILVDLLNTDTNGQVAAYDLRRSDSHSWTLSSTITAISKHAQP